METELSNTSVCGFISPNIDDDFCQPIDFHSDVFTGKDSPFETEEYLFNISPYALSPHNSNIEFQKDNEHETLTTLKKPELDVHQNECSQDLVLEVEEEATEEEIDKHSNKRKKKRDIKSEFKKHGVAYIQSHTVPGFIIKHTKENGKYVGDPVRVRYSILKLEKALESEEKEIYTLSWKTCEKNKARKVIIGSLFGNRNIFTDIDKQKERFVMDLQQADDFLKVISNKIKNKKKDYGFARLS